jgi:hypothetical protein
MPASAPGSLTRVVRRNPRGRSAHMGQRPWRSKSAAADRLLPTAGHRWTRCGVRGAVEAASSEHEFTRSGRTAAKRLPARRSLGRKPGRKARSLFCPATGGRQKETRDAIIPGRRRREVNRAGAFSPVLTSPLLLPSVSRPRMSGVAGDLNCPRQSCASLGCASALRLAARHPPWLSATGAFPPCDSRCPGWWVEMLLPETMRVFQVADRVR